MLNMQTLPFQPKQRLSVSPHKTRRAAEKCAEFVCFNVLINKTMICRSSCTDANFCSSILLVTHWTEYQRESVTNWRAEGVLCVITAHFIWRWGVFHFLFFYDLCRWLRNKLQTQSQTVSSVSFSSCYTSSTNGLTFPTPRPFLNHLHGLHCV